MVNKTLIFEFGVLKSTPNIMLLIPVFSAPNFLSRFSSGMELEVSPSLEAILGTVGFSVGLCCFEIFFFRSFCSPERRV